MKLLIVDDSSIMRRTIERNLQSFNLDVVGTASNGFEAIEMLKANNPDVVTLDITMPEMDGLTCLEHIMSLAPQTKVMVVTALSDKLTGLKALDLGARGYVCKPINDEDFKSEFERLLNRQ